MCVCVCVYVESRGRRLYMCVKTLIRTCVSADGCLRELNRNENSLRNWSVEKLLYHFLFIYLFVFRVSSPESIYSAPSICLQAIFFHRG